MFVNDYSFVLYNISKSREKRRQTSYSDIFLKVLKGKIYN